MGMDELKAVCDDGIIMVMLSYMLPGRRQRQACMVGHLYRCTHQPLTLPCAQVPYRVAPLCIYRSRVVWVHWLSLRMHQAQVPAGKDRLLWIPCLVRVWGPRPVSRSRLAGAV